MTHTLRCDDDGREVQITNEEMLELFQLARDFEWCPDNDDLKEFAIRSGVRGPDIKEINIRFFSGTYVPGNEPERESIWLNMRSAHSHSIAWLFRSPDVHWGLACDLNTPDMQFALKFNNFVIARIRFLCGHCILYKGAPGTYPITNDEKEMILSLADDVEYGPAWWLNWFTKVKHAFKALRYYKKDNVDEINDLESFLIQLNSIMLQKQFICPDGSIADILEHKI